MHAIARPFPSLQTTATLVMAVTGLSALGSQAQLPAFPGADGAAKFVSGGRGGLVYHVTRLDGLLSDSGGTIPGTFWYGLNNANFPANVPRTIVFDVAGTIHMGLADTTNWTSNGNGWDSQSRKGISPRNLTVAGQTAPGPVIFMGGTLKPQGTNQIFRNFTIASGYGTKGFWEPNKTPPSPPQLPTSFTMDGMDISGQHLMIDHIDAFFGTDETISCNEFADNLTIQYCNHGQALNYATHAYGHLLQAGSDHKVSFLYNLDAHIRHRLPRVGSEVGTGARNDFRGNVIYNWLNTAGTSGGNQPSKDNFINNFYIAGAGGEVGTSTQVGGTDIFSGEDNLTFLYASGNLKDLNKDSDLDDTVSADTSYTSSEIQPVAYDVDIGITLSARDSLTNVFRYVGSRWWERDYDFTVGNTNAINTVGERLIHETATITGQIKSWADNPFNTDPNEGVEWRALWALRPTNGVAPFNRPAGWDTDQDGMPDYWEIEHGLNPNVANNNNDFDADGYTDLEEYLNDVAAWPAPGNICFNGTNTSRYAEILNWRVYGVQVNITNLGNITTFSDWQPSKYDTAVISNSTVLVDAVGQHAGTLRLAPDAANNATLNITNGWLKVANTLEIAKAGTGAVNLSGGKLRVGTLTNGGGTASFNFTGGTLAADNVTFNLINQGGTISPGDSPGTTHVTGNLSQDSASTLAIEVNGTNANEFDQVIVDGTATLAGTLTVTFTNGYVPPAGSVVTILTCTSRSGTFATVNYPSNDVVMAVTYLSSGVKLEFGAINVAPVFQGVSDRTVNVGVNVVVTNIALDGDVPADVLTFSLLSAPPTATLDTNSGVFAWRPTVADSDTTNLVTVAVNDDGAPSLSDTQSFNVIVNLLTQSSIANAVKVGTQLVLTVNGQIGPDYAVESSINLTNWSTLFITNSPAMPFFWTNLNISTEPVLFYRIKAGPPLL